MLIAILGRPDPPFDVYIVGIETSNTGSASIRATYLEKQITNPTV